MRVRSSMKPLVLLLVSGLLAPVLGCSFLLTNRVRQRVNPAYRSAAQRPPKPTMATAIFECPPRRRGVKPNRRLRDTFRAKIAPALRAELARRGVPAAEGVQSRAGFCQDLYEREALLPWKGTEALAQSARAQLGADTGSVIATFVIFPYYCTEAKRGIYNRKGQRVGALGTGKDVCKESGKTRIYSALITSTGEVVWRSSAWKLKAAYHKPTAFARDFYSKLVL